MISICYITARKFPAFNWFVESLLLQSGLGDICEVIVVDRFAEAYDAHSEKDVAVRREELQACVRKCPVAFPFKHVPPKPNVWAGKYRLTPRDWWVTSSYRNTGLCHATGDFIAFLDDRCVLTP